MTESTTNNALNVSVGKGVAGGYFFRAPLGSTKPKDIKTKLDAAFKCCGFISEDGIVFATETDTEDIPDMNGETIESSGSSHMETFTAVLAEIKKLNMETLYGEKNVKDANGILEVHVKGDDPGHYCYVFDGVLKNGRRWRRIIHDAQVKEMGDFTISSTELAAREATFAVFRDQETGDFYTDYFESTETQGA